MVLLTTVICYMDVSFGLKLGSKMGQIWEFYRMSFSTFWHAISDLLVCFYLLISGIWVTVNRDINLGVICWCLCRWSKICQILPNLDLMKCAYKCKTLNFTRCYFNGSYQIWNTFFLYIIFNCKQAFRYVNRIWTLMRFAINYIHVFLCYLLTLDEDVNCNSLVPIYYILQMSTL